MTISELIERLEKADRASDELDAHIRCTLLAQEGAYVAQSTFNGAWCVYRGEWNGKPKLYERARDIPHSLWTGGYTASVDAVVALLQVKLPGWFWRCGSTPAFPKGWAFVSRTDANNALPGDEHASSDGKAATPAIALCIATLKAIHSKSTEESK